MLERFMSPWCLKIFEMLKLCFRRLSLGYYSLPDLESVLHLLDVEFRI